MTYLIIKKEYLTVVSGSITFPTECDFYLNPTTVVYSKNEDRLICGNDATSVIPADCLKALRKCEGNADRK